MYPPTEKATDIRRLGRFPFKCGFSGCRGNAGRRMLQPIVIRMMGGEYLMSSPLTISNPVYSVTVEPYDESPVIISGGKKLPVLSRPYSTEFRVTPPISKKLKTALGTLPTCT